MRATYSPSTRGMHHISLRQGLRPFSASRRRTVSPDRLSCPVSLTMASASSSNVQRARPLGGVAQAVATSKASSLPVSLRSAPGRGSSLSARSRLPSTKRRLVRYTVEPPTATVRAISSSLRPASAASNIWARLSLREARLIVEVRQPIPAEPGQLERYDYEYRRNGTVNLFVCIDAHRPWRKVKVTERRTAADYAQCMRELVDVHYPDAACIRVVQDNLSTHSA